MAGRTQGTGQKRRHVRRCAGVLNTKPLWCSERSPLGHSQTSGLHRTLISLVTPSACDGVSRSRLQVMKIMPVQKQTRAGQRTRFKAFVVVGDSNGHIGLGVKCAKEVATAIRGAIILAKLSVIPVRRGYWGNKIGKPHTVPCKVGRPLVHRWYLPPPLWLPATTLCGVRPGSGAHCWVA